MRFTDLRFTRMFAGGDGGPKHLFPNCPHVKRMMGITRVASVFKLSANSRLPELIRCQWCRGMWLNLEVENPEMPEEVVQALQLVPKEAQTP